MKGSFSRYCCCCPSPTMVSLQEIDNQTCFLNALSSQCFGIRRTETLLNCGQFSCTEVSFQTSFNALEVFYAFCLISFLWMWLDFVCCLNGSSPNRLRCQVDPDRNAEAISIIWELWPCGAASLVPSCSWLWQLIISAFPGTVISKSLYLCSRETFLFILVGGRYIRVWFCTYCCLCSRATVFSKRSSSLVLSLVQRPVGRLVLLWVCFMKSVILFIFIFIYYGIYIYIYIKFLTMCKHGWRWQLFPVLTKSLYTSQKQSIKCFPVLKYLVMSFWAHLAFVMDKDSNVSHARWIFKKHLHPSAFVVISGVHWNHCKPLKLFWMCSRWFCLFTFYLFFNV